MKVASRMSVLTIALAAAVVTTFASGAAVAQNAPVQITAMSQANEAGFPLWLANKLGYLKDNGVQVKIQYFPNGGAALASGAAGDWQAGWIGAPPAIRSQVPPGGSVRRAVAVTFEGLASVAVVRDVTRHRASNRTPVCGPASSRTGSEMAPAAGGGAPAKAATASRATMTGRSGRMRGARAAASMGATQRSGSDRWQPAPGGSPVQGPAVTIG